MGEKQHRPTEGGEGKAALSTRGRRGRQHPAGGRENDTAQKEGTVPPPKKEGTGSTTGTEDGRGEHQIPLTHKKKKRDRNPKRKSRKTNGIYHRKIRSVVGNKCVFF